MTTSIKHLTVLKIHLRSFEVVNTRFLHVADKLNTCVALVTADDFVAIGGGVPIVVEDRVVGALGVSGATAAEDAALASAIVAQR